MQIQQEKEQATRLHAALGRNQPTSWPSSSSSTAERPKTRDIDAFAFPPLPAKSSEEMIQKITNWINSVWDASSKDSDTCEKAFAELRAKVDAAMRRRAEEDGRPLRAGASAALALDLWYNAEERWRKTNRKAPVAWRYTGSDSGDEESEDGVVDGDDSDDADSDEDTVRPLGRRRRRAPPHPRRRSRLSHRAMMVMIARFHQTRANMARSEARSKTSQPSIYSCPTGINEPSAAT